MIGHQWWWEFRYPEFNLTTANELHVPVGRIISLKMGAYDVVHSFWLPQFAGKRDVFPNRETRLWFNAEEPGEYSGQCAEFCGIQHGRMAFRVVAQPAREFQDWVAHMKTITMQPAAAPGRLGPHDQHGGCGPATGGAAPAGAGRRRQRQGGARPVAESRGGTGPEAVPDEGMRGLPRAGGLQCAQGPARPQPRQRGRADLHRGRDAQEHRRKPDPLDPLPAGRETRV